jgi:predicted transcriptional regulator
VGSKYTVEFNAEVEEVLSALAARQHVTKAQVIRRAIALMNFFDEEASKPDQKIGISDADGKLIREVII